jgi:hypothetical protein
VWAHVDVWKATSDIDGNAKTVKSDKSLFTTNSCRLIVNVDAIPFQLGQRMDGVALSGVSILMHDENHGSTVGMGARLSLTSTGMERTERFQPITSDQALISSRKSLKSSDSQSKSSTESLSVALFHTF